MNATGVSRARSKKSNIPAKRKESAKFWADKENRRTNTKQPEQLSPISEIVTTPQPIPQRGEPTCLLNDITVLRDMTTVTDTQDTIPCKRCVAFDTPDTRNDIQPADLGEPHNAQQQHVPFIHSGCCWDKNTYDALRYLSKRNVKMLRVANNLECYVKDLFLALNSPNKMTALQIHDTRNKYTRLNPHIDALEKVMLDMTGDGRPFKSAKTSVSARARKLKQALKMCFAVKRSKISREKRRRRPHKNDVPAYLK